MTEPRGADALLRDAEHALEAGDSARDVVRTYFRPAERAGALRELRALLRDYDGPGADSPLVEPLLELLERRRDGHAARREGRVRLSDVEPSVVRWLWPARIPLGKLTILDGDPGVLKSTLALDLAARLSVGASMPDGAEPDLNGPRGTVLLTAEDGLGDTVRPRLDAAGADGDCVIARKTVAAGEDGEERRLPTVDDLEILRDDVEAVDAALLVIDPLVAYLGTDVNSYRDQDVRAALTGLAELADEEGVAVLAVRHLNKSGGGNPLYRGGGSIGLIAAARSGLLVARDPEEPEGDRRILAVTKQNLAPEPSSLAFRPETTGDTVTLSWEDEETAHDARDLLEVDPSEERTAREEAADYLRERLGDGPAPVEELKREADRLGVSWRTFRRAKKGLGVEHFREGGVGAEGRWSWRLPANPVNASGRVKAARGVDDLEDGPEGRGKQEDENPYPGQPSDVDGLGEKSPEPATLQADLGASLEGGE